MLAPFALADGIVLHIFFAPQKRGFFAFFAKLYGATHVTVLGRREERLAIAKKLGATEAFINLCEAENAIKEYGGADVIFECSGNPRALKDGMPYLKCGGKLACYSVYTKPYAIDKSRCPEKWTFQHIDPNPEEAIGEVCELLEKGKIPTNVFITHKWTFEEAIKAFEELKTGSVIKGIIKI